MWKNVGKLFPKGESANKQRQSGVNFDKKKSLGSRMKFCTVLLYDFKKPYTK